MKDKKDTADCDVNTTNVANEPSRSSGSDSYGSSSRSGSMGSTNKDKAGSECDVASDEKSAGSASSVSSDRSKSSRN